MPAKLLRPNVGIYVATSDVFSGADITAAGWAPTATQLNDPTKVYNISPAVTDDYTLNLTTSDSDNSISVTDSAQAQTPTLYNYEASLDGFMDSGASTSYYNKFKELLADAAVGTQYYLIKRIGVAHGANFAAGDTVDVFGVTLDLPVDLVGDGEMIRKGARFLTTGEVAVKAVVTGTGGAGFWGNTAGAIATGTKMQSNANVDVWWVPTSAVTNESAFLSGTAATILNSTSSGVVRLTEAIAWDGYNLGANGSNAISDKGILDKANAQARGFAQFSGALTFFRGVKPTYTATITGTSGQSTITVTGDVTANLEVGQFVKGTGIGAGAKVVSFSFSTNTTITLSVANSGAVSGTGTFYTSYSLAYDTFKAITGGRVNGYLVTRVGKAASATVSAGDKISLYKFVADSTMDNTAGEDSIKFMVNFMPQGLLGVNKTAA